MGIVCSSCSIIFIINDAIIQTAHAHKIAAATVSIFQIEWLWLANIFVYDSCCQKVLLIWTIVQGIMSDTYLVRLLVSHPLPASFFQFPPTVASVVMACGLQ